MCFDEELTERKSNCRKKVKRHFFFKQMLVLRFSSELRMGLSVMAAGYREDMIS